MAETKSKLEIDESKITASIIAIGNNIEGSLSNSFMEKYDTFLVNPKLVAGAVAKVSSMSDMDDFCQILLNITDWDADIDKKFAWIRAAIISRAEIANETIRFISKELYSHGVELEL